MVRLGSQIAADCLIRQDGQRLRYWVDAPGLTVATRRDNPEPTNASGSVRLPRRTPTARRTQMEATVAAHTEIVRLACSLDYYPIAINQRLRVLHPRFGATERAVTPNYCLCTDDRQLFAWDVRQLRSFLQNGIQDSFRNCGLQRRVFSCRCWRQACSRYDD
jgi:hypothetical protein